MDENAKYNMRMALKQSKEQIQSIRENLLNVIGAEKARHELMMAEFNILSGMHEISWIGKEVPKKEEDNASIIEDDNPSA